jgi:glycosyltransferase involved in cell wall biosynthesis
VKLRGLDLVCLGFADWDAPLPTNQHQLMRRLGGRNRVLFVESLGLRGAQLARSDVRRIVRRVRLGLGPPREAGGVYVLSPLVLPFHHLAAARRLNARILPLLVRRAARGLGMEHPVLWAYVPQAELLIPALRPRLVVYHCVDDIAAQKGVHAESFRAAEERFAARADLVIASAPALAERMRALNPNVLLAPNVADTDLFATALEPGPVDPAVELLPHPRVVFHGAIVATKLDVPLLVELARLRPEWSFALVGPTGAGDPGTDVSPLEREPNLHVLGGRPYEALPTVLRGADAAIIPYALNPLTSSIFPMKVYEYLAAGLPVVTTPLPALAGVSGLEVAGDAESMAAALERELDADDRERRAERSRAAAGFSWRTRLEQIERALPSA